MSTASLTPNLLKLQDGSLAVAVLPYGLHVAQVLLRANGQLHDVVLGPLDYKEYAAKRTFLNPVAGRYANRLPVGEFPVEKDGEKGTVRPIENDSPGVSIHGGPGGFDTLVWTSIDVDNTKNFSTKEKARLKTLETDAIRIFSLTSAADDQGFPGKLYTEVLFALVKMPKITSTDTSKVEIGAVALVHRARLDPQTPVATPVNLTQHWGFNLSASLEPHSSKPSVNDHELRIASAGTIELTPNFLATGEITPTVKDGPYDHNGKLIGDQAPSPQGYDEYYMFKNAQEAGQPIHVDLEAWEKGDLLEAIFEHAEKETPVELYSNTSRIRAEFQTNQPGVQLCTAEWLDGSGTMKAMHGGSPTGGGYGTRAAAFLEFHEPHAAWLHPWGAKGDTIISTKMMYNNYVKVMFTNEVRREECEPPAVA